MRHYSETALLLTIVGAACYAVYKMTTAKPANSNLATKATVYGDYTTDYNNNPTVINGVEIRYA